MATDTTLAPLGSIENPIKFQGQDYKTLRMECLMSGELFCDPTFPAEETSIAMPDLDPKFRPIEWLRPKEIEKNAVFVDETFGTTDVRQGQLSDCWVMASLSCLALHSNMFEKVVPPNQSLSESYAGIFHFTFWQCGEWVEVVVDDRLPAHKGHLLFSRSNTSNEFWSALVEKAYAKLYGSYGWLSGGSLEEALEDFTGGIAYSKQVSSHTPQDLWKRLKGAMSRGGLLSCSIQTTDKSKLSKVGEAKLYTGHAYAITDCDKVTKASQEFLLLKVRNPGDGGEYCGPWSDRSKEWDDVDKGDRIKLKTANDGEFWISAEAFRSLFTNVAVCNLNPDTFDEENTPASLATWVINEHAGSWAPGSTAGGSRSYKDTYYQNPQFKLVLKEQDQTEDEDKTKKCTVVVELLLKNTRENKRDIPSKDFDIYKVPPDFQGVRLGRDFFDQNTPIEHPCISNSRRNVVCKLRLDPGNYIIVAFNKDPKQSRDFLVRTFSKTGNTLGPV